MQVADIPANEAQRLRALRSLQVLDTDPEPELDALVQTASLVCGVPMSSITLVDSDRQWFKARVGMGGVHETSRDIAFCAHTILGAGLMEVPDASLDPRFKDNPLVLGSPDVRFYAGAPVAVGNGQRVGTLCVIDHVPRQLTAVQREILSNLAIAAGQALEGRRAMRELQRVMAANEADDARFKQLGDALPIGIFYADEDSKCTHTNRRWQEMHGLSAAQSVGASWMRVVHFDDLELVRLQWDDAVRHRAPFMMELRIQRPDRSIRYLRVHAQAAQEGPDLSLGLVGDEDDDESAVTYVGSAEDITDYRAAERGLYDERSRLANVIEGAHLGTWEWHVPDGQMRINARWAEMLGYKLSDWTKVSVETWQRYCHPDDLARATAMYEDYFQHRGAYFVCEMRLRHREGHWVWVLTRGRVLNWLPDGKPGWMFGTHEDITERKAQEEALRQAVSALAQERAALVENEQKLLLANERLELATECGGIGVWDWDVASNTLVWDAQNYTLYRLKPFSVPGTYELWAKHVHPEDRPMAEAALQAAVRGERTFNTEFRIVGGDGEVRWLRGAGKVIRDAQGQAVRVVGANWDVT